MLVKMSTLATPMVLLPVVAFLASAAIHAAALTIFPRLGLLDFPQRYGLHRSRIPYPTGILAVAVFVIFAASLQPLTPQMLTLLSGIVLLAIVCMVDDRTPLPPIVRLAAQLGVIALLVAGGIRIDAVTNPLPGVWSDSGSLVLNEGWALAFSVVFTVLWLLFTVNALNWFDGIPGQVSTLSTIGFLTIGFLSLSDRVDQPSLALLSFLLAAISLGVLCFDRPPPLLLMGDTGAMFFGLMLGVLTIYSGGKVATAFLVLGVPLIDLLFVVVRRLRRGERPWRGNATDQHLHHRLLKRGWSPKNIILLTATIGTAFGITALFLDTWEKVAAGGVLFAVMLVLSVYSNPK